MAGMIVTATFEYALISGPGTWIETTMTGTWQKGADPNDGFGSVLWIVDKYHSIGLQLDGDSWSNSLTPALWTLSNYGDGWGWKLFDLTFHGSPGFTVFDLDTSGLGTDGSAAGKTFSEFSGSSVPGGINASYLNPVALGMAAPIGDIYETLHIEFMGVDGLQPGPDPYTWKMDTDKAVTTPVPEPGLPILLCTGLLLVTGMARVRRQK